MPTHISQRSSPKQAVRRAGRGACLHVMPLKSGAPLVDLVPAAGFPQEWWCTFHSMIPS